MSSFSQHGSVRGVVTATVAASSVALSQLAVPLATATPTASNVVISEVYGGGGNSGATLMYDFVELYNPTDAPIVLDGWSVQYLSANGTTGTNVTPLRGTIEPGGYFLIKGAKGNGGSVDFTADVANNSLAMSGSQGAAVLVDSTDPWTLGSPNVDLAGFGAVQAFEGSPAQKISNTTSGARDTTGTDTDNNAADFTVGTPAPQYTGGDALEGGDTDPTDPQNPGDPETPSQRVSIEEIQGTGESTPLDGQQVETAGWVTASYPEGGLNGFFIQMGGEGALRSKGAASGALFVYTGSGSPTEIGTCVIVTGTAGEYNGSTQLSKPTVATSAAPEQDCGTKVTPITEPIPTDPAVREANEGMLFQPSATYTVTNNYEVNSFGSVDLVEGEEPLFQATAKVAPGPEAIAYEEENQRKVITLDDAATVNYFQNRAAKDTPLPYLGTKEGIRSLRTGDTVRFQKPVVLGYNFTKWGLQPTERVTGETPRADLPIEWEDSRAAELEGPQDVGGTHSIASFNVLNYFVDVGANEEGCGSYKDREGNPVTANNCDVRGAYSEQAFKDQQAKIVAAINKLDVSVLGLEEIENSAQFGQDRDAALKNLVDALNAAGGQWEYVKSPATVPGNEDVIRTAFIYQPELVKPVGESAILDDPAFDGIARQPLAQVFEPAAGGQQFVAVVNHYKSKGSVARDDVDTGDGQGNNAQLRKAMSQALLTWLGSNEQWKNLPQFVMGDFNAYAKEDAMRVLEEGGFTNLEDHYKAGYSYQFSGRIGSLDHVMANEAAMKLATGADVWDINADESNSFEYSRRNYNVTDFYAADPFRSSDHDPIKVGFNLTGDKPAPDNPGDTPGSDNGSATGSLDTVWGKLGLGLGIAGLLATLIGGGLWWWQNQR